MLQTRNYNIKKKYSLIVLTYTVFRVPLLTCHNEIVYWVYETGICQLDKVENL